MKPTIKLLSAIFAVALAFTACGGGGGSDEPEPTPTPTPTPTPDPGPPSGKHLTMTCDMPADASEVTISLTGLTSEVRSKSGSASWLTTTLQPYTSGTPQLTVACQQNLDINERSQDVTLLAHSQASTSKYEVSDTLVLTVRQTVYQGGGTNTDDPNNTYSDQPAYSRTSR